MTSIMMQCKNGEMKLKVEGHTSGVNGGPNVICAAVSMLVQAAIQMMRDMLANDELEAYEEEISDGCARLRVRPREACVCKLCGAKELLRTGFEMLSSTYPDQVRIGWGNCSENYDSINTGHTGETAIDAQERL